MFSTVFSSRTARATLNSTNPIHIDIHRVRECVFILLVFNVRKFEKNRTTESALSSTPEVG